MPTLKTRTSMPKPNDPNILKGIAEATTLGHPIQTAGRLIGLGHTTAWDWLRKGTALLEASPDSTPEELGSFAVFAVTVKDAEAKMVDKQLQYIQRDASQKGGWTAAMTLLERRRPKDFGRNQQITVDTTVTYVHELGPGAEAAILARREELESLQGATETDTGGLPALPPAQQPDASHTDENQP